MRINRNIKTIAAIYYILFIPFVIISIIVLNKSFNTYYNCNVTKNITNTTSNIGMCKIWEFTLASAVFSAIVAALLASSSRMLTNYGNGSLYCILIISCSLFLIAIIWGFIEISFSGDSFCCLDSGLEKFQYVSLGFDILSLSTGLIIFLILFMCTTIFENYQREELLYHAHI